MKMFFSILRKITLLSFGLLFTSVSLANIVVTGTRAIYPAGEKEISVKITNKGKSPVLIQSWIDTGDASVSPDKIRVPFVITPPINRLDAGKGQTLRISYTGGNSLPDDRESVFWLNALEIPASMSKDAELNKLQIAFRTRIKVFFRPATLKGDSTQAAESLKWEIRNGQLTAINNSPFHVTLLDVHAAGNAAAGTGDMIRPFSQLSVKTNKGRFSIGQKISWQYLNDWGAVKQVNSTLK
ncbi:molecular chaperone [Enterobacter kobei]|uniref:fimbrial biogenesis chaperone n=1 Tax=Enterobacter kobei TaxID=208224 RepID=UPI003BEEEEE2